MVGRAGRDDSRPVVYTSDAGRMCPACGKPVRGCTCRRQTAPGRGDGVVRVYRDRRNRRGKTMTIITGVSGNQATLDELAGTLKRLCGSGGTVKDGTIEIQGDHRDLLVSKLVEMGFRAKAAGG